MPDLILPNIKGLLHGGDYNPEQWPRDVWQQDMALMGPVRFGVASIGIFSWASLEPEEGVYDFDWLDDLMGLLHNQGRFAILATPSAGMPAWLAQSHPEVLRVNPDGGRNRFGRRVNYCWTSPEYRKKVAGIAEKLAGRYGAHPALAAWHLSNEYGGRCHCNLCRDAFRLWLRKKFDNNLDALNGAYWTTFWSHTYRDWDEIDIPGGPLGEDSIIGLAVDWRRFCSDQIVDFFRNEVAPLRRISSHVPVTTNLMGFYDVLDPASIAPELDFVAWDSYPLFAEKPLEVDKWVQTSLTHDLNRSMKRQPFLMIESTPDGSNWYPVMRLKRPGVHLLEGVQAVAHGSEGVMYFQWRKGRGSSEQYHGAVVGHDGTDKTRVYGEVRAMGELLDKWGEVRGSSVKPEAALIYDWESVWAIHETHGPRQGGRNPFGALYSHYKPFWESGIPVDVVASTADLSEYKLVVAPMLYMLKPGVADAVRAFVASGGTFVLTYWSAMADENCLALGGGCPGGLRDVFGIWAEETDCLFDHESVDIEAVKENSLGLEGSFTARQYCDLIHLEGAEAIAVYASQFYAGRPAVTLHPYQKGEAAYISARNDDALQAAVLLGLAVRARVKPVLGIPTPAGVTVQVRRGEGKEFIFVMNCTGEAQSVQLGGERMTRLDGTPQGAGLHLPPYGFELLARPIQPPTA